MFRRIFTEKESIYTGIIIRDFGMYFMKAYFCDKCNKLLNPQIHNDDVVPLVCDDCYKTVGGTRMYWKD